VTGNTSASGGYLTQTNAPPNDGLELDLFLQAVVTGITGLPGNFVRQRYQPEPSEQPPQSTDWCAIGFTESDGDLSTYNYFESEGNITTYTVSSSDQITVDATFYGPNAVANATAFRTGFNVAQNREVLTANGLGFVEASKITRIPELINTLWVDRVDVVFIFNRVQNRTYNIESVLSALVTVQTNNLTVTQTVPD
jgi:hypothetical protein